jgi:hypothetical protein
VDQLQQVQACDLWIALERLAVGCDTFGKRVRMLQSSLGCLGFCFLVFVRFTLFFLHHLVSPVLVEGALPVFAVQAVHFVEVA